MLLDKDAVPQPILDAFGMTPHPEGGWYVRTFAAPAAEGERSALSAIYFLLRAGERSHWHRIDASEVWLWHAGAPVRLQLSEDGARAETHLLGTAFEQGERPQVVVPEGVWQSASSAGAWSLVSCIVGPAFDFAGFTLAEPGWSPELPLSS